RYLGGDLKVLAEWIAPTRSHGPAANGTELNGDGASTLNGHASSKPLSNGHAPNGHGRNGHDRNGHHQNGHNHNGHNHNAHDCNGQDVTKSNGQALAARTNGQVPSDSGGPSTPRSQPMS